MPKGSALKPRKKKQVWKPVAVPVDGKDARIAELEEASRALTKEVLVQMMLGLRDDNLYYAYNRMRDVLIGKPNFKG